MSAHVGEDERAAVALAVLRATLIGVIFASEQLVDARRLAKSNFFVVLVFAVVYAGLALFAACSGRELAERRFIRVQPALDVFFLAGLAYTSGGAFSDVRKAFFVIPLAAAFSERPRTTARWSLIAVLSFTLQAVLAGGHPSGAQNNWLRMTLNQDLYLAWTGAAATLLALALRHRSAHTQELAESRQRLVNLAIESVEQERTRLAGALHDAPVQNLIAARHDLRRAARTADPEAFHRLGEAIDDTIAELREEIFQLHPHVLDHVGLSAALEQIAQRCGGEGEAAIEVEIDPSAGEDHRQVLFALGRELLVNAVKHARAHEIRLGVSREARSIVLEVADDGCGIPDGRVRQALLDGHIGLASVRERVAALGGVVTINTAPGSGTVVRAELPTAPDVEKSHRHGVAAPDRLTPADTLRVSTA